MNQNYNGRNYSEPKIEYSNITTPGGIPELAFRFLYKDLNTQSLITKRFFIKYSQYQSLNMSIDEFINQLYFVFKENFTFIVKTSTFNIYITTDDNKINYLIV
jgi:hypothetical protein